MRDEVPRKFDTRNSEVVVLDLDPKEAAKQLRQLKCGRFYLAAMNRPGQDVNETKRAYKAEHFRLMRSEPMFVCRVGKHIKAPSECRMTRIVNQPDADRVAAAAGRPQIREKDMVEGAPLRLFAAWEGDGPVAWVRSIRTNPTTSWVSNLYVKPTHRRMGIGRALMSFLLDDDGGRGIGTSILLASSDGAKLYPLLGYCQIGTLQLFSPVKSHWDFSWDG